MQSLINSCILACVQKQTAACTWCAHMQSLISSCSLARIRKHFDQRQQLTPVVTCLACTHSRSSITTNAECADVKLQLPQYSKLPQAYPVAKAGFVKPNCVVIAHSLCKIGHWSRGSLRWFLLPRPAAVTLQQQHCPVPSQVSVVTAHHKHHQLLH